MIAFSDQPEPPKHAPAAGYPLPPSPLPKPTYSSVASHSLKLFCLCREFKFKVLEILFTHCSLPRPCGCTFANGYLDAEIVT